MTWLHLTDDAYQILLGDGRLQPTALVRNRATRGNRPLEQAVAEQLYSWGKLRHHARAVREIAPIAGYTIPNPLHVWVVGSADWMTPTAAVESVDEQGRTLYKDSRLVILGMGLPKLKGDDIAQWDYRARRAGFVAYPDSHLVPRAMVGGALLTRRMAQYYEQTRLPATSVLVKLGVPVAYCGDSAPGEQR